LDLECSSNSDNDDPDYEESVASRNTDYLSSSYIDEEELEDDDNIAGTEAVDKNWSMYDEHKKSFYAMYQPLYESPKSCSHLIDEYNYILSVLQDPPSNGDPMSIRKIRSTYVLRGNVDNYCIARQGKTVTTYE
jgi:hypothetical protein